MMETKTIIDYTFKVFSKATFVLAFALFFVSFGNNASAQKSIKCYNSIYLQINFLSANGDFDDYVLDSEIKADKGFLPSAGIGYSLSWYYNNKIFWGGVAKFSYGLRYINDNYKKQEEVMCFIEGGYRLRLSDYMSLDLSSGFGLGYTEIFYANNNQQFGIYSDAMFIIPLTVKMMFSSKSLSNAIGVYIQAVPAFSFDNKMIKTGTDTEIVGSSINPSLLSIGVMYSF